MWKGTQAGMWCHVHVSVLAFQLLIQLTDEHYATTVWNSSVQLCMEFEPGKIPPHFLYISPASMVAKLSLKQ